MAMLAVLALWGCAGGKSAPVPSPQKVAAQVVPAPEPKAEEQRELLKSQMAALPGARIAEENGQPVASYPDEVLFGKRAVLPFPGGAELLEPLAELIKANPGRGWSARVRAMTGISDPYDQALAKRRAQILGFYFQSKGISAEEVNFTPLVEAGPALDIRPGRGSSVP